MPSWLETTKERQREFKGKIGIGFEPYRKSLYAQEANIWTTIWSSRCGCASRSLITARGSWEALRGLGGV
jgi:hypothetical protein